MKIENPKFEMEIRKRLSIFDRGITIEDTLHLEELDCSEMLLDMEDCKTISLFKNLKSLSIKLTSGDLSFLQTLEELEELFIEFCGDAFDLSYLMSLKELEWLEITGDNNAKFVFQNTESLANLHKLKRICLHEFGKIDLAVLKYMPQLNDLYCACADQIDNMEAISNLTNLRSLVLADIAVDNLDFLKNMKRDIHLDLCRIEIYKDIDLEFLKQFEDCEVEDLIVDGKLVKMLSNETIKRIVIAMENLGYKRSAILTMVQYLRSEGQAQAMLYALEELKINDKNRLFEELFLMLYRSI